MQINCIRIDTTEPGLKFYTTGRYEPYVVDVNETRRKKTRDFLKDSRNAGKPMVLAINATAWTPWPPVFPDFEWTESKANLTGLAISDGTLVSPANGRPSLLVDSHARLDMQKISAPDVPDVRTAVTGISANWCLLDGAVVDSTSTTEPRTGYGLSSDARYLYWMIIDGRKVSQGAYVAEVGAWLKYFGADDGINMDGGGSSTLVWWNPAAGGTDKTAVLNTVSESYGERPTGNNLGIYFATNGLMPTAVCAVTAPPQGLFSTLPVRFDGGGSQDADGSIVNYAWMFGDGTQGSGSPVSHSYAQAGSYTCTLMVTDNDGNTARTDFPIQIEDVTAISLVGGGVVGGNVILKNNAHFAFLLADSPNYQTPFPIGVR